MEHEALQSPLHKLSVGFFVDHSHTTKHQGFSLESCNQLTIHWSKPSIQIHRNTQSGSFLDYLCSIRNLSLDSISILCATLWCIWKARNAAIFEGRPISISRVLNHAESLQVAYNRSTISITNSLDNPPILNSWRKPPPNAIKINVDAGFRDGFGSAGMIARDEAGGIIHTVACYLGLIKSAEIGELLAIRFGMKEAENFFHGDVIVEYDSLECIARVSYSR